MENLPTTCSTSPLVSPAEQTAPPEWITAKVVTLLSHYYQLPSDRKTFKALMMDWIKDLHRLPQRAIEKAIEDWRRTYPRSRPGPGDIRKLAESKIDRPPRRMGVNPPGVFTPDDMTPEQLAQRRRRADELMKEFGFYRGGPA